MNLSEDRMTHLSHLVLNAFKGEGKVSFSDEKKALITIKQAIHNFGEMLDHLDDLIRQKIDSMKRQLPEGSQEWDLLYRRLLEEELRKKGL